MKRGLLIIRMLLLLFICVLANQTKSAENVPRSEMPQSPDSLSPAGRGGAGELMLVSVRGHSAIINADLISAEREALKDALRSAVEQAVGTFVSAETLAKNFVLISDKITTKTEGYIKTYQVLYRSQEDSIYTVLIKAQVIPKFVKNDLIALKILQEAMRKPRVMIVVPEQDINNTSILDPSGETEMIRQFVANGFKVVDQTQVKQIRTNDEARAALGGDNAAAAAIGRRYDAEVIIFGEAFSESAGQLEEGVQSYRAHIEARVIECDTADIIAAGAKSAGGIDIAGNVAAKKALENAGKYLADALIEQIVTKWNERVIDSRDVRLSLSSITFNQLIQVEQAIKKLGNVADVHRRSFEAGTAVLDVKAKTDAQRLAEELTLLENPEFTFEITNFTANRIDISLKPKEK
jgi:hypothetical protein